MYRALPAARQVASPRNACRSLIRVSRRRFATESAASAAPPKKNKRTLRRIILYTTAATATFYVGSAFVSFQSPQYYNFFNHDVPLGAAVLEYAEDNGWDDLTVGDVFANGVQGAISAYEWTQKQFGGAVDDTSDKAKGAKATISEKVQAVKASAEQSGKEAQGKVQRVVEQLKTKVHKAEDQLSKDGKQAAAIAKHRAIQFSEGIEVLVQQAEDALAGKPTDTLPEATTTPEQPAGSPPDSTPPRPNVDRKSTGVYESPLPVGFEPPPGFSRPAPSKADKPRGIAAEKLEALKMDPLPLVAPSVKELNANEPVLSHLASTIDDLASFLRRNPSAAGKARDVLDTAKGDLTELARNFDRVREEEQRKLEVQMDEQAREYTLKMLEMELAAQDKMENQEAGFRQYFEEEKTKMAQTFKEKLEAELSVQREIINERLKEEVINQGIELQRRWIREVKLRVEEERGGRLAKLDELAANLKRLERLALDNSNYLDENLRIHSLWSALRALHSAVAAPARRPFRDELRVLRHVAAAKEDPIVATALETLESSDAPDVGVEPFADLASWFTTSVAPRVSSVALVPEQNAGLLSHLASHLFSTFAFRRQGFVAGNDVLSVISRAEYYLNEKDLDGAARELNQLHGTPKVLLQDWLEAARRRLEVQQALEIVQAQATVASLLVV